MVGFSDIVCGRYTASALHTVSCPASRRACSRLDDIEPFRFDSFTYACDASGIVAPIAGSRHRHSRTPSSFRHPSTPEAPFLDRHYPASSVVRASPPPWRPGLAPHGVPVGACTPPTGLPVLPRLPSSIHADATTPAETVRCTCRFSSQSVIGLPLDFGGSVSALLFSRPAQRSLSLRPVWSLNRPRRPFDTRVLRPTSLPP